MNYNARTVPGVFGFKRIVNLYTGKAGKGLLIGFAASVAVLRHIFQRLFQPGLLLIRPWHNIILYNKAHLLLSLPCV